MLRNFFKTALRNIIKYRAYSLINFVGLTSGLALSLLIITYVRSELSYDRFHTKADRIYRLRYTAPNGMELATTPPPIAPRLKEFFPEVEDAGRMYGRNVSISRPDDGEVFEETDVFFADPAIMNILSFEFVKGTPEGALNDEFTVLITEEMATKYFGERNPVGQTLRFSNAHAFTVTGVVKNFPINSHIRFNMLVPYENMYDLETDQAATAMRHNFEINYVISHSYTYVMLKPGADPASVNSKMGDFIKKYAQPSLQVGQVFALMPLVDIHLNSTLLAEPSPTNSMSNLIIFAGIGMLTLLIASINYINLSTAQSLTRIKEIGIRKIMGSMRYQLISQFLAESFLFCLIALLLSFAIFHSLLPMLNEVTGKNLQFNEVVDSFLMFSSLILLVIITLLAGGYPAYFVTRFNSVHALKGDRLPLGGSQFMRKVLVVFQLTIACMLLTGSLIIMKQIDFLDNRPLGFKKDQVITVPLFSQNVNGIFRQDDSTYRNRLQSFRNMIEAQSGVRKTTLSSTPPGLGAMFRGTVPEGFTSEDNMFVANLSVDYDFLEAYDMKLVAGRSFSRDFTTDPTSAFVVNETAIKEFNWESPEKALGRKINREGKEGKVIGVISDFHFMSLTTPVSAMVLEFNPNQFNSLSIRLEQANTAAVIEKIQSQWNIAFPEKAFEYTFLDEQLNEQYLNFRNFSLIIQSFTIVAILIACLGVYGLVLFVVKRKVKEIGVRKVLGASVVNILKMIYRDFAWLLALGFLLAIPLSYFLLNAWLRNFTYHIAIDAATYGISLLIIVITVSMTIGYQAVKASMANPVTSLRTE